MDVTISGESEMKTDLVSSMTARIIINPLAFTSAWYAPPNPPLPLLGGGGIACARARVCVLAYPSVRRVSVHNFSTLQLFLTSHTE